MLWCPEKICLNSLKDSQVKQLPYPVEEADVSPSLPSPRGLWSVQPITDGLTSPPVFWLVEEELEGVENGVGVALKSGCHGNNWNMETVS